MRRHATLGLIGLLALSVLLYNLPVGQVTAQVPFGAVRVMDGSGIHMAAVNHSGQLSVTGHLSALGHVSSVVHISGTITGFGKQNTNVVDTVNAALQVNCVTGCASGGNTSHITSVTHIAGIITAFGKQATNVVDTVNSALQVNCVVGCSSGGTVSHITSVSHIYGTVSLVNRAGTYASFTSTSLDVNLTNQLAVSQSGSWTIQAVHQGGNWNVAHVTSVTHISGVITAFGKQATNVVDTVNSALQVNCVVGCSSGGTVSHITSVTHISGAVSVVNQAGVYATFNGTSLNVNVNNVGDIPVSFSTPQAVTQSGEWNVRHITSATHVSGTVVGFGKGNTDVVNLTDGSLKVSAANHLESRIYGPHATGAIHVSGISNIGSGAQGTATTAMVCHSTLAIHVAAAAPGWTQLIHLTSSNGGIDQSAWRIYICGILLVSSHAQSIAIVEGSGTTCQTTPIALIGSRRVDDSVSLAANGGFSSVSSFPWLSTTKAGNNVCIGQSSRTSGTVSGIITYRAGP